jgi:hypothetical protein
VSIARSSAIELWDSDFRLQNYKRTLEEMTLLITEALHFENNHFCHYGILSGASSNRVCLGWQKIRDANSKMEKENLHSYPKPI